MPFDDADDFDFESDDLSDEEKEDLRNKMREEKERLWKHPLLLQAKEILSIVDALLDTSDNLQVNEIYGGTLRESAMIITAKLSGAINSESKLLCLQNAALVREHGEYLRLSNHTLNSSKAFDKKYTSMFRQEMEKFRLLFKDWAQEINDMENDFEDEWGLFVR